MNLRDAARAFLFHQTPEDEANLRAALAAPPEPGWGEGYRAGVEAMRTMARVYATDVVEGWYHAGCPGKLAPLIDAELAGLPVPSAPTPAPEPKLPPVRSPDERPRCAVHSMDGDRCIWDLGHGGLHRYRDSNGFAYDRDGVFPAPEAPAESAWLVVRGAGELADALTGDDNLPLLFTERDDAEITAERTNEYEGKSHPRWRIIAVRVEPAPVEPEETHR